MSKHHSHELSDHPEVQWALDLLKPDPNYQPSVFTKYATEVICVGVGVGLPAAVNMCIEKPIYAGIQRHIVLGIAGYALSQVIKKMINDYQAERDAKLRDYIIRHPELFPEPERFKYSQILEEWIPTR